MKLLLTSNGVTSPELEQVFLEMFADKSDIKVALIPTAGDSIEWFEVPPKSNKWFHKLKEANNIEENGDLKFLKSKGYKVVVVDLKEDFQEIQNKLQNVDAIFVGGGDANYLLDWGYDSKLNLYLKKLLDGDVVYVGASAGNSLLIPDIGLTWWEPERNESHVGFGIVDFVVIPHCNSEDKTKTMEELKKRKEHLQTIIDFPWRVYLLKDGQAVKVDGSVIEHIGIGDKESFR